LFQRTRGQAIAQSPLGQRHCAAIP
jgi:hypothetical protein